MINLTSEINSMMVERDMKFQEVTSLIKDMLRSAYKRKFGTEENVEVKFYEDSKKNYYVEIFAKKLVVAEEDYFNAVTEIPLDEAREVASDDVEIGDELEISLDPKSFEYSAVQSAKQRGQAVSKELTDDKTYYKAKSMEFSLVKGELKKKSKNGTDWFVDIGFGDENLAVFPLRGQSPRETYDLGDNLRFFVEKVDKGDDEIVRDPKTGKAKKKKKGVKIYLSRSSKEFVKALLENTFREDINNGNLVIKAIARQPGIRTKIAVDTKKADVDPVGTAVGKAGQKIQQIMSELEGEKIDVVRYNTDPIVFIANALIPAQVQRVIEVDPQTKYAIAIVDDSQQGIAIGQNGVNVKLAKALCDWLIDVKTKTQFNEMESTLLIHENVGSLFKNDEENENAENAEVASSQEEPVKEEKKEEPISNEKLGINEDETPITDIGLSDELVKKLHDIDIWAIEEFFEYSNEELLERGLSQSDIDTVRGSVEIVTDEEEDSFECPICHKMVPSGVTVCPNCGAEFEFE